MENTSKKHRKKAPTAWLAHNLDAVGFPKKEAKALFIPDWWDAACETDAGLIQQLALKVAAFFGFTYKEAAALFAGNVEGFALPPHPEMQLKATAATGEKLPATQWKLHNLAKLLRRGFSGVLAPCRVRESLAGRQSIKEIALCVRQEILRERRTHIDFYALVSYCWQKNIILAHSASVKSGSIHGAAMQKRSHEENPVIVLCSKDKAPWQAFRLAHELGHIILGHGGVFWETENKEDEGDNQEHEANEFARFLLLGDQELPSSQLEYGSMPEYILSYDSKRMQVEVGILALFMAKKQGNDAFKLVNRVYVPQSETSPMEFVNNLLWEKIHSADFSYEEEEMLNAYLSHECDARASHR